MVALLKIDLSEQKFYRLPKNLNEDFASINLNIK